MTDLAVHYTGDTDEFIFFHEDGPLRIAGADVSTAFMRAREAVDACVLMIASSVGDMVDKARMDEFEATMKRLEHACFPERRL